MLPPEAVQHIVPHPLGLVTVDALGPQAVVLQEGSDEFGGALGVGEHHQLRRQGSKTRYNIIQKQIYI